jgi:competence protein ComEA
VSDLDRPRLALYVALGLVVCVLGVRYLRSQPMTPAGAAGSDRPVVASPSTTGDGGPSSVRVQAAGGGQVTVYVAGAVRRPGVYWLSAAKRVDDALRLAGGPKPRADLTAVNLAAKLEDGRQILVPERVRAPGSSGAGAVSAPAAPGGGGASPGSGAPGAVPTAPINLNTATLEQLDTLDGVGPGIAQRIIDYREQHGGFGRVDELGEVPGIGEKRLATLRPLVTV